MSIKLIKTEMFINHENIVYVRWLVTPIAISKMNKKYATREKVQEAFDNMSFDVRMNEAEVNNLKDEANRTRSILGQNYKEINNIKRILKTILTEKQLTQFVKDDKPRVKNEKPKTKVEDLL